jgi:hypothetical protein
MQMTNMILMNHAQFPIIRSTVDYILGTSLTLYYIKVVLWDALLFAVTGAELHGINEVFNNFLTDYYFKGTAWTDDGVLFPYAAHCRYSRHKINF